MISNAPAYIICKRRILNTDEGIFTMILRHIKARYHMGSSWKRFLRRFFDSQPRLNRRIVILKRNFDEVNRMLQSLGQPNKKRKHKH